MSRFTHLNRINEADLSHVNAGDGVTVGVFTTGLGTSVIIGASLGPVGAGVAAVTYTVSFGLTYLLTK